VLQECVQGVRRSWVGASLNRLGGCRQEADFTVICLPGEAWVRLSALLVRAGAKLEYRLWGRREWATFGSNGAEAEYRKPSSSRRDSKPG
jgi:hypothetical protein